MKKRLLVIGILLLLTSGVVVSGKQYVNNREDFTVMKEYVDEYANQKQYTIEVLANEQHSIDELESYVQSYDLSSYNQYNTLLITIYNKYDEGKSIQADSSKLFSKRYVILY